MSALSLSLRIRTKKSRTATQNKNPFLHPLSGSPSWDKYFMLDWRVNADIEPFWGDLRCEKYWVAQTSSKNRFRIKKHIFGIRSDVQTFRPPSRAYYGISWYTTSIYGRVFSLWFGCVPNQVAHRWTCYISLVNPKLCVCIYIIRHTDSR